MERSRSKATSAPGEPFLYARDSDGYLVEIWYELPTMIDPPVAKERAASVVFVCEHGSAKSVIAAAHFARLAAASGLHVHAISRGTDPDAEFPPNVLNGLARDRFRPLDQGPKLLGAEELANAGQVVTFCALPDAYLHRGPIERWEDVPAVSDNYDAARSEIVRRVGKLIERLGSRV